jgi:hypothetical protein
VRYALSQLVEHVKIRNPPKLKGSRYAAKLIGIGLVVENSESGSGLIFLEGKHTGGNTTAIKLLSPGSRDCCQHVKEERG